MWNSLFTDRVDAGRRLAALLRRLGRVHPVVVGLPRGGVIVAAEVARALRAPLDVVVVRKLGMPLQPELAMGAVGEHGARYVDETLVRMAGVTPEELAAVERRERATLDARARAYRGHHAPVPLAGRTVVVVDDGVATGSTARAACQVVRAQGASHVVIAVPVAPPGWEQWLAEDADELVAVETPQPFTAIGQWYRDFSQVDDDHVIAALGGDEGRHNSGAQVAPGGEEVEIRVGSIRLRGSLRTPPGARGVVLFAHGSGSSRFSPRNRFVADVLDKAGLGTLLFDLLTAEEELDRSNVFDIALLASRLAEATAWLRRRSDTEDARVGYFGASTGAAAALSAAAGDHTVAAVVSRGGRPDLAAKELHLVTAPTLLIVGGDDDVVLDLNRMAQRYLRCPNRLAVVPGAGHLFEEPGTLEQAAVLARDWFAHHLARPGDRPVAGSAAR